MEDRQLDHISKADLAAFKPFLVLTPADERAESSGDRGGHFTAPLLQIVHQKDYNLLHQQKMEEEGEAEHRNIVDSRKKRWQVVANSDILELYPPVLVLIVQKLVELGQSAAEIFEARTKRCGSKLDQTEKRLAVAVHSILSHLPEQHQVSYLSWLIYRSVNIVLVSLPVNLPILGKND